MDKRPLSVTIIAWFLIISSVVGALTFWSSFNSPTGQQMTAQSPLSPSLQMAFAIFNMVLNIVIGVALLKRQSWARYVYVGLNVIGILALLAMPTPSLIVISVIFLAVIVFFLFGKRANDWFTRAAA